MNVVTRGRSRDDTGASAVEFSLIAIVFFTLVVGMIQYSMYFWSTQSAANAARDAARRGAVGQTCADLNSQVASNTKLVQNGSMVVTRKYYAATTTSNYDTASTVTPATGTNVRVKITYNSYDLNFPFLPFLNNGQVTESAVARVENYTSTVPATFGPC